MHFHTHLITHLHIQCPHSHLMNASHNRLWLLPRGLACLGIISFMCFVVLFASFSFCKVFCVMICFCYVMFKIVYFCACSVSGVGPHPDRFGAESGQRSAPSESRLGRRNDRTHSILHAFSHAQIANNRHIPTEIHKDICFFN